MRKSQTTYFLLLLFYIRKFVRKHIWKNVVYIVTFALPFFQVTVYWKCSNTNAHLDFHWFCRPYTSIQNTCQQTRYFNVDFDSNGLFLLFICFKQVPSIQGKKSILIWAINFIKKSIRKGIEILVKRFFSFSIIS